MSMAFILGFPLALIVVLGVFAIFKRKNGNDDDLPPTGAVSVGVDGTESDPRAAAFDPTNAVGAGG